MNQFFDQGRYRKAYDFARQLHKHPELPTPILASCGSILGTSEDEKYLYYAEEAFENWKKICRGAEEVYRISGDVPPRVLFDKWAEALERRNTARDDHRFACKRSLTCYFKDALPRCHKMIRQCCKI